MVCVKISIFSTLSLLIVFVRYSCSSEPTDVIPETVFLAPRVLSGDEDSFVGRYQTREYLLVNIPVTWLKAGLLCRESYKAIVAKVNTDLIASFLAEAIFETNFLYATLWIGARKYSTDLIQGWAWMDGSYFREYGDQTRKNRWTKAYEANYIFNRSTGENTKNCMGFQSQNHGTPLFVPMNCKLPKPVICERVYGTNKHEDSTHSGWIQIGQNYYKIFQEHVSYKNATRNCFIHDTQARLALVNDMKTATHLAKYMLIGRPAIENAWIGARYYQGQYTFLEDNITLSDVKINDFPPWRHQRWRKVDGCVLLDRHIQKTPIFLEARCERHRPYICYKRARKSSQAK